jgi:hypothetical protein
MERADGTERSRRRLPVKVAERQAGPKVSSYKLVESSRIPIARGSQVSIHRPTARLHGLVVRYSDLRGGTRFHRGGGVKRLEKSMSAADSLA